MAKLKIISYNAQGLKGSWKRKKVLNWIVKEQFDFLCIQESHIESYSIADWKRDWKGDIFYSAGSNNSRGVCILIRQDLEYTLISDYKDSNGRWLILVLKIDNIDYVLGTYYGPNEDNPSSVISFIERIDSIDCPNVILGGDFNFVMNIELDKLGGNRTTNKKCREVVINWMEEQNMLDIWRIKNPKLRKF